MCTVIANLYNSKNYEVKLEMCNFINLPHCTSYYRHLKIRKDFILLLCLHIGRLFIIVCKTCLLGCQTYCVVTELTRYWKQRN